MQRRCYFDSSCQSRNPTNLAASLRPRPGYGVGRPLGYLRFLRCPAVLLVFLSARLAACQMLQLPSPVEFFDKSTRFAPVGLYFDVQFEKDFCAQHSLKL